MINIHLFYCSFLNIAISLWFPKFNCYFIYFPNCPFNTLFTVFLCQTDVNSCKKNNNPYLRYLSDEAAVNQQHYYN